MVNRYFCVPVFWVSESFNKELIKERTLESVFRTIYWLKNPKPRTLEEHIEQEKFVAKCLGYESVIKNVLIEDYYNKHKDSDNYPLIFNFLYGDKASQSLGFPSYGIDEDFAGFNFVKSIK